MIARQELYDRGCVAGLIHVIEQVPLRASVRGSLPIDETTTGLLLLWSSLRWERTFAIQTLEQLQVDLWSLTREVDEALRASAASHSESVSAGPSDGLDSYSRKWLDLAAEQARSLQHDYLGIEHLLLALLAHDARPYAAICQRCGLTYVAFKQGILDRLARAAPALPTVAGHLANGAPPSAAAAVKPIGALPAAGAASSWIAEIDRPAVGVPRRFGIFLMMLMVTLYALLFSLLKVMQAPAPVFVFIALFFTFIGVGQAVLLGGRYPRAASIWTGMVILPIETLAFFIVLNGFSNVTLGQAIGAVIGIIFAGIPLGAILGYLFGTVTAGGFYLVERYEERKQQSRE